MSSEAGLCTLSLDGVWKLRWHDEERSKSRHAVLEAAADYRAIDAVVPGEVHLDALREGWIGDPLVGTNCLAARWIEECLWSYRRRFDVPAEALAARAWLVFDGLDLMAGVHLNGERVGEHQNAFCPCRIEVTGKLRATGNHLVVLLDSGLYAATDKPPIDGIEGHRLTKMNWLRKPSGDGGFDWAPRLLNVGIFKPVRLEWTDAPCRADQLALTCSLGAGLALGVLHARQYVQVLRQTRLTLTLEVVETGDRAETETEMGPGEGCCELRLEVRNPKLWWPAGHGGQPLYTVRVRLDADGCPVHETTRKVGFRHVRVNQDRHPEKGRYFTIEINGRKIFCKGSNWIPADIIRARLDRPRYERLIALAREAHFNFLRVWGGGLYESDDFYNLCDRHGILVWQDFSFAGKHYPAHDEAFVQNVLRESVYNVRRLVSHASLVVWCGNNETDWNAGANPSPIYMDHALFHRTLRKLVADEDGTRHYQPSSPHSPDSLSPNEFSEGDQHPWNIGFGNTDFRGYRAMTCRFPTEGGFLGPRALPTMLACLPEGPLRRIDSLAWRVHDNSIDGEIEPSATDAITEQWLGMPLQAMTVEEYVYWGGLLQGEALTEYITNFRRRMFDSSGAVYWMFNDCWPATRSWTIVDYYLRRCPSFHPVRRAMQPVSVVVAESGDEIVVFGINDTDAPVAADLRYGVFTADGRYPLDRAEAVTLVPNASTRLAAFARHEWAAPEDSAAFARLATGGDLIARHRLFLPFFKDLRWAPMHPVVRVESGRAVFESDTFVWGVCLDLDGECALDDNFFDIWPGQPYTIAWKQPAPPRILRVGELSNDDGAILACGDCPWGKASEYG